MDYEDSMFDSVIDPLQKDLKNFMENLPHAEAFVVKQGVQALILRFQRAILSLIQHGDWPHLAFPVVFDPDLMTSARQVFGATDEDLERFYNRAQDCFKKENYEEASDICLLLSKLEPFERTYFVALGMCEQLKGEYEAAAAAYAMAIDLDTSDLTPGLYAARCLVDLGEVSLARALLIDLLGIATESEHEGSFITEASQLLSILEGKL